MNIATWLFRTAMSHPRSPALLTGTRLHADYGRFAARASALATHLRDNLGVKPGDCVAIYMKNRVEYLELMYAVWWLGAVVVPVNHKLHRKEVAWIANDARVKVVCTDNGDLCHALGPDMRCQDFGVDTLAYPAAAKSDRQSFTEPLSVEDDHLAWLFYTSGTTGQPKGVMLSHRNLMAMSLCYTMDVDEVRPEDAALYAAPMSHGAGLYNFVHVRRGSRHIVPESRGFDAAETLALGEAAGPLSLFAAPTIVKRLVDHAEKHGLGGNGLRTIVYGGGPMYEADIKHALKVLGPRFVQIYGQGESPMTITSLRREVIADHAHPQWHERLCSVGQPQSCIEVRVVEADLRTCPPGVAGEVIVRGPTVMLGYWCNEKGTRDTLRDGWLSTGDIGHLSEDGFLTLTDRSKDVIISGGTNIYPREVEEVLASHPGVFEVAVVGASNREWGEEVVAFVVTKADQSCTANDLDDWCRSQMAAFKRPRRYEFCDELPKNNYGKIPKAVLRAMLEPG